MNFSSLVINKDSVFMQEVFSHIFNYCNEEIIVTDKEFNVLFHNSKCINEHKNISLFDITNNFMNKEIKENIENFKKSDKNHIFFKLVFDTETLKKTPIDIHICKIKNRNNIIKGYSVIIKDISQELKNKIQKETFIDIISHDLKNPMRANIQILELILKNKFGKVENNLKIVLDELLNSCRFMNYMADNLLIKYKNEFDLYELQRQSFSVVQLVKEQCNKLMNILKRKKQTIELVVKGDMLNAEIDVEEMSKVVSNLIINASEQSIENSKIVIEIENNVNDISVSFIDYGYPQKPEFLNGIFEEYIASSQKFRKVGFGLELFNCRKIIEAHGGQISAKNEFDTGTAITFSLPLNYCG
ncbi:MAG: PAS domain-containing sensor histidine kinase [Candidatus Gastranaerophilales bacterium]|nr:PAS domain-containing sensor histidine kinase [Candidatus Gastranaerophilales bacterium]